MKRHIYLLFSVLFLGACSTQKQELITLNEQVIKTEKTDSILEKNYNKRLNERINQLTDYIQLVIDSKTSPKSKLYYAHKAKNLFASMSHVHIDNGKKMNTIPIDSFFNALSKQKINLSNIDSLTIPIWNSHLMTNQQDSIVYVGSQKIALSSLPYTKTSSSLPIKKEKTENGLEWIPLFGDLTIHSKPTESIQNYLQDIDKFDFNIHSFKEEMEDDPYKCRIKLVDEFFERFNERKGRIKTKKDNDTTRQKNLLLLFDRNLFSNPKDSVFREALLMTRIIMDNHTQIHYSDSNWFAKVTCCGKFKGKPTSFNLYLKVEPKNDNMFKWSIAKAEGKLFKLAPTFYSDKIFLMPDDHETNFMSLHRITREKDDYITNYASKDTSIDETSVFFSYVYTGLLDIDSVQDAEFIFLQVPHYRFSIKYIEKENNNSGWLINSFQRMKDEDKALIKL